MTFGRYAGIVRRLSRGVVGRGCCCESQENCEYLGEFHIIGNNFPSDGGPHRNRIDAVPMCLRHVVWCNRELTDGTFENVVTETNHDYVLRNAVYCSGDTSAGNKNVHVPYRPVLWEDCVDANPVSSLNSDVDFSMLDSSLSSIEFSDPVYSFIGTPFTWKSVTDLMSHNATSTKTYTFVLRVETFAWRRRAYFPGEVVGSQHVYLGTSKLKLKLWRIEVGDNSACLDDRAIPLVGQCGP